MTVYYNVYHVLKQFKIKNLVKLSTVRWKQHALSRWADQKETLSILQSSSWSKALKVNNMACSDFDDKTVKKLSLEALSCKRILVWCSLCDTVLCDVSKPNHQDLVYRKAQSSSLKMMLSVDQTDDKTK